MTSKKDLLRALRNAEEDRDRAEQQALQCSGEMMHQKERADAARGRAQEIADQLRQLAESRSLEIRTEALRQTRDRRGLVDLSLAYRIEQYLAKGVTLPSETPNLTTAVHRANQAVASLAEELDEGYSGRLNTIIEALRWAGRVSQENIELAAENERIRQINLEQSDMIRGANREISGLKREVHDQHNEIEEKTARLQQTAKKIDPLEDFQTSDEAKAFSEVYQAGRQDGVSIYDTAHLAWQAARDYFGGNKPVSEEEDQSL